MRLRVLAVRLLLLGALHAHAFARRRPLLFPLEGSGDGSGPGSAGNRGPACGLRSGEPPCSPSPRPPSPGPVPPSPGPSPGPSPAPPSPDPDDPDDPDSKREHDQMFVPLVLLACFLVSMAGLMSGLTLGLMSLDQVDIEILRRSGTERQRRLAQRIQPVLSRPHVLLVTLLVCNALAAEALPLVLDRLADPVTAIILSVSVVLFFGEIIPQAACSRYGLEIGATSAPFVRLLMLLTAPVSYPIGWVLDRVLGDRHTALFRRAELKALVDIHREGQEFGGQLSADEVSIIKGALDMTHKTARHCMTPIDMVFMLPSDAVLNEETLTAIMASGHSRIPVHRPGDRSAILGIMLVKELLMVDKNQGKTVGRQKVRSLPAVRADTPLYDMLKLFEIGRSHMALLMQLRREAKERQRKHDEERMMVRVDSMSDDPSDGDSEEDELTPRPTACPEDFIFDPTDFEPVGIITIEDVLEELLQVEILDETDKFVDNLQRTPVSAALIMRSLPPHLRTVFGARALLPRIGGAAFMDLEGPLHSQGAEASVAAVAGSKGPAAAAAVVQANGTAAAAVAVAGADGSVGMAGTGMPPQAGEAGKSPRRGPVPPRSLPAVSPAQSPRPLSPQRPSSGGGTPRQLPAGRARSGATTPTGGTGSSMHGGAAAGYLFKQGSLGASLVAEALRQEIAAQLAAAQAGGGGSTNRPAERSRSLSPLPSGRRAGSSRHSLTGHDGTALLPPAATRPSPFVADAPGAASQRQGQSPRLPQAAQAQPQQHTEPVEVPAPIFPGLRRSRSDAAQSVSSGAATPRLVVPLRPPPPRRSTNLSQRVQEQIDLLQPLLNSSSRRGSADLSPRTSQEGPSGSGGGA
ncbi:hypothetical protein ABPG75_006091 [Micractinium tetrahymenae]